MSAECVLIRLSCWCDRTTLIRSSECEQVVHNTVFKTHHVALMRNNKVFTLNFLYFLYVHFGLTRFCFHRTVCLLVCQQNYTNLQNRFPWSFWFWSRLKDRSGIFSTHVIHIFCWCLSRLINHFLLFRPPQLQLIRSFLSDICLFLLSFEQKWLK